MNVNMRVVFVMKTIRGRIKRCDYRDCRGATFTALVTDYPHNPQEVMGFVNIVNVASFLFQKRKKRVKAPWTLIKSG